MHATTRPEEVGLSSDRLDRFGMVLGEEIARGALPGAVVLIARTKEVQRLQRLRRFPIGHRAADALGVTAGSDVEAGKGYRPSSMSMRLSPKLCSDLHDGLAGRRDMPARGCPRCFRVSLLKRGDDLRQGGNAAAARLDAGHRETPQEIDAR
jgi:hypothetical protein